MEHRRTRQNNKNLMASLWGRILSMDAGVKLMKVGVGGVGGVGGRVGGA